MGVSPDYRIAVDAARNRQTKRPVLYEHAVSREVMSAVLDIDLLGLGEGTYQDRVEGFRRSAELLVSLGYDVYPFEGCITQVVQGGEGLMGRASSIIRDGRDLDTYPWDEAVDRFFERFSEDYRAMTEALPPGMKAVGGVGNGLFELVQDFVPLTDLAYLSIDQPQVYAGLWEQAGSLMLKIWERFLDEFGDTYCICRFGDDLGFKSSLLERPEVLRDHVFPWYRRVIDRIKSEGVPFLLHSCGAIWNVMDDLIALGIDAKHSNEDEIAPFDAWVDRYGEQIGNFGGIDMNVLCTEDETGIREYVRSVMHRVGNRPGIAWGSGNQIADYVPPDGWITMTETVREFGGR